MGWAWGRMGGCVFWLRADFAAADVTGTESLPHRAVIHLIFHTWHGGGCVEPLFTALRIGAAARLREAS